VTDVTPYTGMESMPTREQLAETLRLLRRAGGSKVISVPEGPVPETLEAVERAGFETAAVATSGELVILAAR
jgi:hypothetical protein